MRIEDLEAAYKPRMVSDWKPSTANTTPAKGNERYLDLSVRRLPGGTDCPCGDGTCVDCRYYEYWNVFGG